LGVPVCGFVDLSVCERVPSLCGDSVKPRVGIETGILFLVRPALQTIVFLSVVKKLRGRGFRGNEEWTLHHSAKFVIYGVRVRAAGYGPRLAAGARAPPHNQVAGFIENIL
jgi:hypothetical protein